MTNEQMERLQLGLSDPEICEHTGNRVCTVRCDDLDALLDQQVKAALNRPVAWLHILHMEGGQTRERLLDWDGSDPDEPLRTGFGVPGRDYSDEYHVGVTPLYTAHPVTVTVDEGIIEAAAKKIFANWEFGHSEPGIKPAWVEGGNSIMQERARSFAREAFRTFITSSSAMRPTKMWKHVKRGTDYGVIAHGEAQDATGLLVDGARVIIYQGVDDGKVWVRQEDEFNDGRFEHLAGYSEQGPKS